MTARTAGETIDFAASVTELLESIDSLLVQVKQCSGVADQLMGLTNQRDQKLDRFNVLLGNPTLQEKEGATARHLQEMKRVRLQEMNELRRELDALEKPIDELSRPFRPTRANIFSFVKRVQNVLDYTPVEPLHFKEIRSAIERLPLLTGVGTSSTALPMRTSYSDLQKVKHRLLEFSFYYASQQKGNERSKGSLSMTETKLSPAAFIGGWLKDRRESQRDLAGKAGISPNTLRKIIAGKIVRRSKISKLAEALDCRYEDLLPK